MIIAHSDKLVMTLMLVAHLIATATRIEAEGEEEEAVEQEVLVDEAQTIGTEEIGIGAVAVAVAVVVAVVIVEHLRVTVAPIHCAKMIVIDETSATVATDVRSSGA